MFELNGEKLEKDITFPAGGLLKEVFTDGRLVGVQTLAQIRERLNGKR